MKNVLLAKLSKLMNVDLVLDALNGAYSLLCDEYESVCDEELLQEYESVIDMLKEAISEVEKSRK